MPGCRVIGGSIPIELEMLSAFRDNWRTVRKALIKEVDQNFGVYVGETFKEARFAEYVRQTYMAIWDRCKLEGRGVPEAARVPPMDYRDNPQHRARHQHQPTWNNFAPP